jgi:hypothetical protein
MNRIIKIKNTELFQELKKASKENSDLWRELFTADYELKDGRIPYFCGGLARIEEKEKAFIFHDCGVSRGGRIIDNTFAIVQ